MTRFQFEPELNCPTPRSLQYRGGFGGGCSVWFGRLFILPHTLVGVLLLCTAIVGTGTYLGVWLFGTDYEGRITQKEVTRGGKGSKSYHVRYIYAVDAAQYFGDVTVSEERFAEASEGQAITVRALDSSPSYGQWPRIPGHSPLAEVAGRWGAALFWCGIMSIFVWWGYVRPWRNWRLVRSGELAQGIVRSTSVQVNKGTKSYKLTYDFAIPAVDGVKGTVISGKMTSMLKEAANAHPGQLVTVMYYPEKPWRNILYTYSDYRAASKV